MGGNRVTIPRWYFNLFTVLLICGLWHGANWTFIVWGGLHGIYLVFSVLTHKIRERVHKAIGLDRVQRLHHYLKVMVTFFLVCFAWIFFWANSISDAIYIISHLFTGWEGIFNLDVFRSIPVWKSLKFEFMIGVTSIGVLTLVHLLERRSSVIQILSQKPIWIRWAVYYFLLLAILLFGNFGAKQFIYFQF
jgi:D-alanyl-lipoteichoic acid acyltransferase DltB (MBOAT superfamily)